MTKKEFLKQLLYILIFIIAAVTLTMLWLRFYTNHGQKLDMPEYVNTHITEAMKDAEKKSFEIIVNDSVHIVGRKGGMIIDQNPKFGAKVKENRKVYVTVTKFNADKIKLSDLPPLYGNDYDQKRKELNYQDINTVVDDFRFDRGEPNHILEVLYNGKVVINKDVVMEDIEIEKGGTLHFILSQQTGGKMKIPDLKCQTVAKARFLLEHSRFKLGEINAQGIDDIENAYIISQSPAIDADNPDLLIEMGTVFTVTVSEDLPSDCSDQ